VREGSVAIGALAARVRRETISDGGEKIGLDLASLWISLSQKEDAVTTKHLTHRHDKLFFVHTLSPPSSDVQFSLTTIFDGDTIGQSAS
jgi:hypothetical protein